MAKEVDVHKQAKNFIKKYGRPRVSTFHDHNRKRHTVTLSVGGRHLTASFGDPESAHAYHREAILASGEKK